MKNKEKILIVDDENINLVISSGLLNKYYNVITSNKYMDIFNLINEHNPDLILLDIIMPNTNGIDICKKIRANIETKNIPIIFITSVDNDNRINDAFEAGGNDYVLKPFRPKELLSRIKTQLRIYQIQEELKELASIDYMTKLYNRRYFEKISSHSFDLVKRQKQKMCLLMIDIDNFKNINDKYGHPIGDMVIINLANKLLKLQRKSDISSRFGGEEFVVLLSNTSIEGAKVVAEKLIKNVESSIIKIDEHKINFTISIGVSEVDINNENNVSNTIIRADKALYEAKNNGKNQVCIN